MLRRAVELQVLETEDVTQAGSLLQDPRELLESIREAGSLDARVEGALARLIELRPVSSVARAKKTTTSAKRLQLPDANQTMAPQRAAGDEVSSVEEAVEGLDPGSSTVAPARAGGGTAAAPP